MTKLRVGLDGLGHVEYEANDEPVRVGGRLLPSPVTLVLPSDKHSPSLRMDLAVIDGLPQCRRLVIESKDSGRDVRAMDLRAVRLDDFIEAAFSAVAFEIVQDADGRMGAVYQGSKTARASAHAISDARKTVRRKVTDDVIREAAEVYREHVDDRPTAAVAMHFGVKHRAAGGYIQRAREAGYLPATTPGKRKA